MTEAAIESAVQSLSNASSTPAAAPQTSVGLTSAALIRTLSVGESGADVTALQTFLENKGYLTIPPGIAKGYFGALTKKAVVVFQKENSIDPIGIVGPMTRAAIEKLQ